MARWRNPISLRLDRQPSSEFHPSAGRYDRHFILIVLEQRYKLLAATFRLRAPLKQSTTPRPV